MRNRSAQLLRRPGVFLLGGGVLGLVLGVIAGVIALSGSGETRATAEIVSDTPTPSPTATPRNTPAPTPTVIPYSGILDGVPMTDEEWEARKDLLPVAVMIDNHPSAYPHAGLAEADLVYEAFVEGGVTRFMAVFWRREAEFIEPIRSVRTPFLIWASELDALIGHGGAADEGTDSNAIAMIAEWSLRSLNAFAPATSSAYYRDNERYAPHDLVTGTTALRETAAALGWAGPPAVEQWLFKADGEGTSSFPAIAGLEVNFRERRLAAAVVQWHWDEATNAYLRFQSGGAHIDARTGEQLSFKNIIVMTVPWSVVNEAGHVLLEQIGEGPARVFLDGKMIEATWRKPDRLARTRYYDSAGSEIAFNRGSTFIEVVGPASIVLTAEKASGLPEIPPYQPPPPAPEPEPEAEPTPAVPSPTPTEAPAATPSPDPGNGATPTPPSGTPSPGSTSPPTTVTPEETPTPG
jgi:hypothetical protein